MVRISNPPTSSDGTSKVFVVYGRNETARLAMFEFLRSIGLDPIEWSQAVSATGEASPYIGTVLDGAFDTAQAVVVLMTPDEIAYLRDEYALGDTDPECKPSAQVRPNVLFEAGMAMGNDSKRTILVELGSIRPFSDITGRHTIRLDDNIERRKDLAQRLQVAGCDVDLSGNDWMNSGDFSIPQVPGQGLPVGKKVPRPSSQDTDSVDLRFSGSDSSGHLRITNLSQESIYEVTLSLPEEVDNFHTDGYEFPIEELPAGKSVSVHAFRSLGQGKNHFRVPVVYRSSSGENKEEAVFLSL